MGSSAELGLPRNECFLPRNNGNRSESIPQNFFGTKFRSQPYNRLHGGGGRGGGVTAELNKHKRQKTEAFEASNCFKLIERGRQTAIYVKNYMLADHSSINPNESCRGQILPRNL